MADKLEMMSSNIIQENIDYIACKFPNALKEVMEDGKLVRKIDFDVLKQELSSVVIDDKQERYQMTWPDKKKSILLANSRINATLRPDKEKSVDFDNTKNLYIEGDNLDVLKLLRETYLGKVKMIYIDPPYNTGNDFVYEDDFAESEDAYLSRSGQFDEQGNRLTANSDSNGRFHTDWLNMMYPRLKIAKDLLREDGAIFISIDDNEATNMKKICDEIFGEKNFISQLIWRKKTGASDSVGFSIISEYILVYTKNISFAQNVFTQDLKAHDINRYKLSDEYEARRGKYYIDNLDRGGIHYSDSLNYPITCPDGTITYPNGRREFTREGWTWTWGKNKLERGIKNGFIEFRKSTSKESGWAVCYKNYLNVNNKDELVARSAPHKNMIMDILNTAGTLEIQKLFNGKVFQYTKPTALLKLLLSYINSSDGIFMDFFSGSGTTGHALYQLNAEDNGTRKFILVQLPEICSEKSDAYKMGYKTICEIGEQRLRLASKKLKEELGLLSNNLDVGFRVLKLDSSNMNDVFYNPKSYQQSLLDGMVSNIKEDRTPLDILFQVMLELGIELSAKIEERTIAGKQCFIVNENDIVACFDTGITDEVVKELANIKSRNAVFRDDSFISDSANINCEQIFKSISPSTTIKVI